MKSIRISLLSALFSLIFAVGAQAQDINQAIEFNNKGAEAAKSQNWATAISEFNQALTILNQLGEDGDADMTQQIKDLIPSLHYFLGQELAKNSKIDDAIAELNKAIEMAKKYDDFGTTAVDSKKLIDQLNLSAATNLLNDKKYEEAIAAFKKVLETDPENGTFYLYIGVAYASLGTESEAITAYQKANDLGNKDAGTRLANIYLTQAQNAMREQKWQNMYDLSQKAAEVTPDNANVIKFIGISAFQLKKYNEAVPALEKTLAANPNAADKNTTIYRLAQSLEAQNKNGQACGYYKQLLTDANFKETAEHKIKNVLKCE